jgi:hypothetical protein
VFAFRNLQQTLLNTKFWNVSESADLAAGSAVPNNLSTTNDQLALAPADDTQADFNNGTLTDVTADDNPGDLQLVLSDSATAHVITTGLTGSLPGVISGPAVSVIGSAASLVDQSFAATCGYRKAVGSSNQISTVSIIVRLSSAKVVNKITLKDFSAIATAAGQGNLVLGATLVDVDLVGNDTWTNVATGGPGPISQLGAGTTSSYGPSDTDISFSRQLIYGVRVRIPVGGASGNSTDLTVSELQVYNAGYISTGSFISAAIDYGSAPASFGALAASITANGETYQFSTQSSADGISWDAAVNVSNGAAIGSTLRRFLRWRVTLNSSTGVSTPVIDKVYVGGTYLSVIHDTGGNILQWGAFQLEQNAAGQTVKAYFRASTTSLLTAAAAWTEIVPGAVPNTAITNTFIQIRIEMSTTDATQVPVVQGFTVNWVLSSASGAAVLQNVASIIILNRYWLAAATLGATENDIVLVLGKSSANSPWHQKDFKFLSFCRFLDVYIAGSSEDGSIYRLEYGYSKNGSAMDSLYETRDFCPDDFIMKGRELLVTCERSGAYDLSVGWSTDSGITWTEKTVDLTRASGDSLSLTKKLNINFMSANVRFRFRINGADQPFSVDELKCSYRPSPQRGDIAA